MGLDGDLGFALGVVFRAYVKAAAAVVDDLPGGPRGYQVLAAAVEQSGANQGAIAQQLGIDRTVLTYLIDDLERAGLVERRQDPADRRNRLVVATDEGRDLCARHGRALRHVERHVLAALGDDEPTFRTLLRRVAARANELDPVADACQVVVDVGSPAPPRARVASKRRSAHGT